MTGPVYLSNLSIELGEIEATVAETGRAGRLLSPAETLKAAGFDRHWMAAPGTRAFDLAVRAVDRIAPQLQKIDAILYATALPESANLGSAATYAKSRDVRQCMDFPASHLQMHFNLHDAVVIGINQQACTGILGAVRLGSALLRSEPETARLLCVTADRFPEAALYEQAYNLISDGASACILSRTPGEFRLIAHHHITNGALALCTSEETAGAFFPYMHRLVNETLQRAGMQSADLAWVVTQNASDRVFEVLASLLGLPANRFACPTRSEIGHVISSDCLANLLRMDLEQRFSRGDRILLLMAGYGSNWQSLLLERQ